MRRLRRLLLLVLTSCSTMGTPYGPKGVRGGYQDRRLPDGSQEVRFNGNSLTSRATVDEYARRRAAELCPAGYDVQTERWACGDALGRVLGSGETCEAYAVTLTVRCR